MAGAGPASMLQDVAPGSLVVVRDEECLVTQVAQTRDGMLLTVHGLSELVAGTTAQFFEHLDEIVPFDPRQTLHLRPERTPVPNSMLTQWLKQGEPPDGSAMSPQVRTATHPGSGVAHTYDLPFAIRGGDSDFRTRCAAWQSRLAALNLQGRGG